jgi:GH43 family beta-xylosidase
VLSEGESKLIYKATGENDVWGDVWAPEMHRGTDGLWYIYSSSRVTKEEGGKKIFVLGSSNSDPFKGEWEFKGRPAYDIFSIDPTVYTAPDGTQYMCYSRVDSKNGQVLDIAKMMNPYTCYNGTTIAKAELDWELVEPYTGKSAILEGAFFLENNGRLFIIYSANGCWSNHYALGVLEYIGGDLCSAKSWKKHPEPLLTYGNEVYGPGHASFFRSPDGTEVWCVYHGMLVSNETVTWAERYCHIQKVEFDETGFPVMGKPIGYDALIDPPSGEIK